jgi:hypothetical protein
MMGWLEGEEAGWNLKMVFFAGKMPVKIRNPRDAGSSGRFRITKTLNFKT